METDGGDAQWLARFASGDATAARVLTDRLAPRCLAVALRMMGDRAEAEDITQEAMLRLWRMAPDWTETGAQVSTWLYQVTMNLCRDRLRRAGRKTAALDEVAEPPDPAPSAEARLQSKARNAALQAALQDLPERQRQAVVLRHIEGLGNPEIAGILSISVEAVESLTARGKRALARSLSGRREELGMTDDTE
jgi:RNA polymerase sigma-70 factor (ECF subfamily)